MNTEIKTLLNSHYGKQPILSRKLKAVIGYWIDYFSGKYEDSVSFTLFGEKISVKDNGDTHYTIFYKSLKFDVYYLYIFEILDFLEKILEAMYGKTKNDD